MNEKVCYDENHCIKQNERIKDLLIEIEGLKKDNSRLAAHTKWLENERIAFSKALDAHKADRAHIRQYVINLHQTITKLKGICN